MTAVCVQRVSLGFVEIGKLVRSKEDIDFSIAPVPSFKIPEWVGH